MKTLLTIICTIAVFTVVTIAFTGYLLCFGGRYMLASIYKAEKQTS